MAEDKHAHEPGWEKDLVTRLATSALNEQRRNRRWNIFFKLLLFLYLFTLLYLALTPNGIDGGKLTKAGEHTAVVEVNGLIADGTEANAESIIEGLTDAFEDPDTKGVVLRINSPGGSPVQAGYVYDAIKRLRKEHEDIPLYAVIVDMGASGGYYIAAAADAIYANQASLVGSIGVLMDGFGFVDTLDKLGVERRLLTAGENKGFLDPFSPLNQENVVHARQMLDAIHGQFIQAVKSGRGERLKEGDEVFSGLIWTGDRAVELGLVDDLASVGEVAREVIGAEETVDFTKRPDLLKRFADRLGVALGDALIGAAGGEPALR